MNSEMKKMVKNEGGVGGLVAESRVKVRYAETDQMGVAYYANYLVWFEVGRTDLLRQHGWSYREMEVDGYSLPVIDAQCTFKAPAKYDDEIEVHTTGGMVSPVRMKFDYEVVRLSDGATSASGHSVHAALNASGRPCRLPERVRGMLNNPDGQPDPPTVYN